MATDVSLASSMGRHLRAARRRRGLTLSEVASGAGMSESFLSQLERGLTGASLDSLQRLTATLQIRVSDLFDSYYSQAPRVLTAEERPVLNVWHLGRKTLLTPALAEHLEVMICHLEPGGATGEHPYAHGDSDELFLLLEGTVELELNGERYPMQRMDSITYRSSQPHRVVNSGTTDAQGLWAIAPPSL